MDIETEDIITIAAGDAAMRPRMADQQVGWASTADLARHLAGFLDRQVNVGLSGSTSTALSMVDEKSGDTRASLLEFAEAAGANAAAMSNVVDTVDRYTAEVELLAGDLEALKDGGLSADASQSYHRAITDELKYLFGHAVHAFQDAGSTAQAPPVYRGAPEWTGPPPERLPGTPYQPYDGCPPGYRPPVDGPEAPPQWPDAVPPNDPVGIPENPDLQAPATIQPWPSTPPVASPPPIGTVPPGGGTPFLPGPPPPGAHPPVGTTPRPVTPPVKSPVSPPGARPTPGLPPGSGPGQSPSRPGSGNLPGRGGRPPSRVQLPGQRAGTPSVARGASSNGQPGARQQPGQGNRLPGGTTGRGQPGTGRQAPTPKRTTGGTNQPFRSRRPTVPSVIGERAKAAAPAKQPARNTGKIFGVRVNKATKKTKPAGKPSKGPLLQNGLLVGIEDEKRWSNAPKQSRSGDVLAGKVIGERGSVAAVPAFVERAAEQKRSAERQRLIAQFRQIRSALPQDTRFDDLDVTVIPDVIEAHHPDDRVRRRDIGPVFGAHGWE